jgi:hypothetical protein
MECPGRSERLREKHFGDPGCSYWKEMKTYLKISEINYILIIH